MTRYTFDVEIPADVPAEVVAEYVGAGLKRFVADRTTVTVRNEAPAPVSRPFASGGIVQGTGRVAGAPASVELEPGDMEILRRMLRAGQIEVSRSHPFDGPERFDDDVTVATFQEPIRIQEGPDQSLQDAFPHLNAVLGEQREIRRPQESFPPDEGDWQLRTDDKVGED